MPTLTRRRDPNAGQEAWLVYYGDVCAGGIAVRTGNPDSSDPWCWASIRPHYSTLAFPCTPQRIGDDPAIVLKNYTKRKRLKQADEKLSDTIAGLAAGFLGTG